MVDTVQDIAARFDLLIDNAKAAVIVAEATQEFITAMDVLRLDQRAVDEVQPVLSTLVNALNKCETIALGFDKSKLQV